MHLQLNYSFFAGLPRRKNLHATVNNISPVKQIVKLEDTPSHIIIGKFQFLISTGESLLNGNITSSL